MNLIVLMSTYTNYFALIIWHSRRFLVTLHLHFCKCDYGLRLNKTRVNSVLSSPCTVIVTSLKTDSKWTIINHQWDVWSSHRAISPSSCHVQPGRNLRVYCSITLISRPSPSNDAAPFCRRKSIQFTNAWGTRKVPYFRGLQRIWLCAE